MSSAASITDARMPGLWADASTMADDTLTFLLAAAWSQCAEYLASVSVTVDPLPDPLSERWVLGNVYQARELWAAARREGDVIGFDTFAVQPRPLTATVKALLRPLRAVPLAVRGYPC